MCLITPDKTAEVDLFHIDSVKHLDLGSLGLALHAESHLPKKGE